MLKYLVYILAGLFAGVGTGFAGLSAACFITPMLVCFLDFPVYEAVGIALASDVLASAISTVTYTIYGHVDFKKSKWLLFIVLAFCLMGSIAAYFATDSLTGDKIFGYWSVIPSLLLGIFFIIKPQQRQIKPIKENKKMLVMCGIGAFIGSVCGFQGAGGGMMLLLLLSVILQYEFHKAVGTSVFIMTFTALLGAIVHFIFYGSMPDLAALFVCVFSTAVFSYLAAFFANKTDNVKLKRITGILLALSGVIMLTYKILTEI